MNRIFGDDASATSTATLDFESDSHLLNATYSKFPEAQITGFAYFLDLSGRNSTGDANSSNTYGARVSGEVSATESVDVGYVVSYAHQVDADTNPTGYKANYFLVEGTADVEDLGAVHVGYELLGSDNGRSQFRTPLATAHDFNGWADSFLDNGGPTGLQDIYFGVSPSLPWGLEGQAVYHKFNTAEGGGSLGWEIDALLKKDLTENVNALFKYAYFDGTADADIFRFWTQLTIAF